MPSTFSSSLNLELLATGENVGTWGTRVNDRVFSLLDEAVAGYTQVSVSAVVSLEIAQASSSPGRHRWIEIVGNYPVSGAFAVRVPPVEKDYWLKVSVSTSGVLSMAVGVSGQTPAIVTAVSAANRIQVVPWTRFLCDGTNIEHAGFLFKPGGGLAINADGTASVSVSINSVLTSLAGQGTGIVVKTASNNIVARTITGVATEISVNEGAGVSANPRIGLVGGGALVLPAFQVATTIVSASGNTTPKLDTRNANMFHVLINGNVTCSLDFEASSDPTFAAAAAAHRFDVVVVNNGTSAHVVKFKGSFQDFFIVATTVSATVQAGHANLYRFTRTLGLGQDPSDTGGFIIEGGRMNNSTNLTA